MTCVGMKQMDKTVKIVVAVHKPYDVLRDETYMPVHAGALGKADLGYQSDAQGEHISEKNGLYCELTALYWAWKNLKCDYLGLVHYRRHFKGKTKSNDKFDKIIKRQELETLLKKTDIILPTKRHYFIETLYSHYEHTHYIEDLEKSKKILETKYPQYLYAFDVVMKRRTGHMFNMFIMKKELFFEYCEFLFSILFKIEKQPIVRWAVKLFSQSVFDRSHKSRKRLFFIFTLTDELHFITTFNTRTKHAQYTLCIGGCISVYQHDVRFIQHRCTT